MKEISIIYVLLKSPDKVLFIWLFFSIMQVYLYRQPFDLHDNTRIL